MAQVGRLAASSIEACTALPLPSCHSSAPPHRCPGHVNHSHLLLSVLEKETQLLGCWQLFAKSNHSHCLGGHLDKWSCALLIEELLAFIRMSAILICTSVLPACMYMYYMSTWCPQRSEEGIRAPGTGVTGGCEQSYRSCKGTCLETTRASG